MKGAAPFIPCGYSALTSSSGRKYRAQVFIKLAALVVKGSLLKFSSSLENIPLTTPGMFKTQFSLGFGGKENK